jgi:hypothetical protein
MKILKDNIFSGFETISQVLFFRFYEDCTCSYGFTQIEGCVVERCAETGGNEKTLVDAVYMAIISFSTVGFGDYTPDTKAGNWLVASVFVFSFFNMLFLDSLESSYVYLMWFILGWCWNPLRKALRLRGDGGGCGGFLQHGLGCGRVHWRQSALLRRPVALVPGRFHAD